MKANFSLFVLIYVTICLSSVAASENVNVTVVNICERGLHYLQSKGLLNDDFPLDLDDPRKCYSTSPETIPEVFSHMLEDIKEVLEKKLPNEAECASSELTQRQRTMDLLLTIRTIQLVGKLSEDEKVGRLISYRNELRTNLKEIAVKCGADETEFISSFRGALEK